jgi:hypothetical protein
MPYQILAKNKKTGQTVTRMDLDYKNRPITDRAVADRLAEAFAESMRPKGDWVALVRYRAHSIANPNWDTKLGAKIR